MSINIGDINTAMDFAEQFDQKIQTGTLDAVVVEAEHAGRLAIAKVVSPELVEFPNKSQNEAATCLPGIAWLELFPETPMALQS